MRSKNDKVHDFQNFKKGGGVHPYLSLSFFMEFWKVKLILRIQISVIHFGVQILIQLLFSL